MAAALTQTNGARISLSASRVVIVAQGSMEFFDFGHGAIGWCGFFYSGIDFQKHD
jgi:hypothetical protein